VRAERLVVRAAVVQVPAAVARPNRRIAWSRERIATGGRPAEPRLLARTDGLVVVDSLCL
jgi:hypothetical protein